MVFRPETELPAHASEPFEDFDGADVPPGHCSGFVAVIGRPNVGKSTLMNALLGEKIAIVSTKPQTTRRRMLGILTTDMAQVIFIDTPGIHRPRDPLGKAMVDAALHAIADADALLFIVDVSVPPHHEDEHIAALVRAQAGTRPVLLALNKADQLKPSEVVAHSEAYAALVPGARWQLISATRGDGLNLLSEWLGAALPEGPRYYPPDQIADAQLRDLAGEFVREQALQQLQDEIPHGLAAYVTEFTERAKGPTYVQVDLIVDRESHKGIVIGKRGARLRAIGAAARKEIERLLGTPVYLDLHVKVREGWRRQPGILEELGYSSNE